jgi:hypothetical protein
MIGHPQNKMGPLTRLRSVAQSLKHMMPGTYAELQSIALEIQKRQYPTSKAALVELEAARNQLAVTEKLHAEAISQRDAAWQREQNAGRDRDRWKQMYNAAVHARQQLDDELGTVEGQRDKLKAQESQFLNTIRFLVDFATDKQDDDGIEVVFDYGDHGVGGLTPGEALRLAINLKTERPRRA